MDLRAEAVLADAKEAVRRFSVAQDDQDRRLYWFAAVGLLRAVGHVLDKVDAASDPAFKKRQEAWWRVAKQDPVHQFIEHTRNSLLKQYLPQAEPAYIVTRNGERIELRDGSVLVTARWYLTDGPLEGREAGEVIREAVAWWEQQLVDLAQ